MKHHDGKFFLKQLAVYFLIGVVLPGSSMAIAQALSQSEFGVWVGFLAAAVFLAVTFTWIQVNMIVVHFARLVKWVLRIEKDLDRKPSVIEKAFYLSPPILAALFIYGLAGFLIAWLDSDHRAWTFFGIATFGLFYGGVVTVAFAKQLIDADDVGAVGPDDVPSDYRSPSRNDAPSHNVDPKERGR